MVRLKQSVLSFASQLSGQRCLSASSLCELLRCPCMRAKELRQCLNASQHVLFCLCASFWMLCCSPGPVARSWEGAQPHSQSSCSAAAAKWRPLQPHWCFQKQPGICFLPAPVAAAASYLWPNRPGCSASNSKPFMITKRGMITQPCTEG